MRLLLVKLQVSSILLLFFLRVPAQVTQKDSGLKFINRLYAEAGGPSSFGSVNYEKVFFYRNTIRYSFRIGLSTIRLRDYHNRLNPDIIVPLMAYTSLGEKHSFEIGAGQVITRSTKAFINEGPAKSTTAFSTAASVGYVFARRQKGFFFRAAYTPVILYNKKLRHWGGLALGYQF